MSAKRRAKRAPRTTREIRYVVQNVAAEATQPKVFFELNAKGEPLYGATISMRDLDKATDRVLTVFRRLRAAADEHEDHVLSRKLDKALGGSVKLTMPEPTKVKA